MKLSKEFEKSNIFTTNYTFLINHIDIHLYNFVIIRFFRQHFLEALHHYNPAMYFWDKFQIDKVPSYYYY